MTAIQIPVLEVSKSEECKQAKVTKAGVIKTSRREQ